jgi:hypothetical protein
MQDYLFYRQIEFWLCILIYCVLAALQLKTYLPAVTYAKTANLGGAEFQCARMDSVYYYAFHGVWPEDNEQAMQFGFHDKYILFQRGVFKDVRIKDGAINLQYNDEYLDGKTITLRPAVPAEDRFGPIIWVIGDNRPRSEWIVFGDDYTDIENRYISSFAR